MAPPAEPRHGPPANVAAGAAFFDDDYHRVMEPFHTEAEVRREVAALRDLVGLAQDDRVLDVGCGWGRHLALLAAAGHDVTGVDLSHALLRRAPADARLVAADMRRLPFRDGAFDVALNLATSLGLFLDDGPAVDALREMARALRPGGRLLVEGMNGDDAVARFAARDGWALEDGTEVRVRRRLDRARAVSHEVLRWRGPGGSGEKRHSLRLRGAEAVAALVEAAGLRVDAAYGDWDGEPAGAGTERVIVVARAPGGGKRYNSLAAEAGL